MILSEYETTEQLEMNYLYYLGIPYEIDRSTEQRIKMIFKGDLDFIKGKIDDFWNGRAQVDALRFSNAQKSVKRLMWVGGRYNPNYSSHPTFSKDKLPEEK